MAVRIACLSQKGGVGKSTLSRLIARTYAASGWNVKICDFHTKQKTSVDWTAMRLERGFEPSVPSEVFSDVKMAVRQDAELLVFDGRPNCNVASLELAREAHLVVIPTGLSLDDMLPQVQFAHELTSNGIDATRILFVLNRARLSKAAIRDAQWYISTGGYRVAEYVLRALRAYENAQNSGRAISETARPHINHEAEAVAGEIVNIVEAHERSDWLMTRALLPPKRGSVRRMLQRAAPAAEAFNGLGEPTDDLLNLNFRIAASFHKRYKVRAAMLGITAKELLQASFEAHVEKYGEYPSHL